MKTLCRLLQSIFLLCFIFNCREQKSEIKDNQLNEDKIQILQRIKQKINVTLQKEKDLIVKYPFLVKGLLNIFNMTNEEFDLILRNDFYRFLFSEMLKDKNSQVIREYLPFNKEAYSRVYALLILAGGASSSKNSTGEKKLLSPVLFLEKANALAPNAHLLTLSSLEDSFWIGMGSIAAHEYYLRQLKQIADKSQSSLKLTDGDEPVFESRGVIRTIFDGIGLSFARGVYNGAYIAYSGIYIKSTLDSYQVIEDLIREVAPGTEAVKTLGNYKNYEWLNIDISELEKLGLAAEYVASLKNLRESVDGYFSKLTRRVFKSTIGTPGEVLQHYIRKAGIDMVDAKSLANLAHANAADGGMKYFASSIDDILKNLGTTKGKDLLRMRDVLIGIINTPYNIVDPISWTVS